MSDVRNARAGVVRIRATRVGFLETKADAARSVANDIALYDGVPTADPKVDPMLGNARFTPKSVDGVVVNMPPTDTPSLNGGRAAVENVGTTAVGQFDVRT